MLKSASSILVEDLEFIENTWHRQRSRQAGAALTVDKIGHRLRPFGVPGSSKEAEVPMAKIDLDTLSIEELATLRDHATDKLAEKVAARQAELEAELEKLSLYGKPAKKSQATPVAKPKKDDAAKEPGAKTGSNQSGLNQAA
jgi:hypothetical protein